MADIYYPENQCDGCGITLSPGEGAQCPGCGRQCCVGCRVADSEWCRDCGEEDNDA